MLTIKHRTFQMMIICVFLALTACVHAKSDNFSPSEADFKQWLGDFKQQALHRGISQSTLDSAFKNIKLNQKVLQSDKK